MIDQIITNFSPKLSSFIGGASGIFGNLSPLSKYSEVLREYLAVADSKQGVVDGFISAFAAAPETFTLKAAGETILDTAKTYVEKIDLETVELIQSMFPRVGANVTDVLTFSDSQGYAYTFIKKSGELVSGVHALISTQLHPQTIKDLLLYELDGEYYLNPIIRFSEYFNPNDTIEVLPTTVNDAIGALCTMVNASDPTYSILGGFEALITALDDEYNTENATIMGMLHDLQVLCNLDEVNELPDIVNRFNQYALAIIDLKFTTRIHSSTIYNLITDLVNNNVLVDIIRSTFDTLTSNPLADLATSLKSRFDSVTGPALSLLNTIINEFTRSGVIGAFRVIVDLLKQLFSTTPTEYQVFNTVNSIPQAFSAGFLAIVSGIGNTLFTILSNVMNPIISLIGSLGLGVINVVSNVINANVSMEYAQVGDLEDVENISPYAIYGERFQSTSSLFNRLLRTEVLGDGEYPQASTLGDIMNWATLDGKPMVIFKWYTFTIKMAYYGVQINNGHITHIDGIVINFFPNCSYVNNFFLQYQSDIVEYMNDYTRNISYPQTSGAYGYIQYSWYYSPTLANFIVAKFEEWIQDGTHDLTPDYTNDNSGQYAGYVYAYDHQLKATVYQNAFITLCYMIKCGPGGSWLLESPHDDVNCQLPLDKPIGSTNYYKVFCNGQSAPFWDLCLGSLTSTTGYIRRIGGIDIYWLQDSASYETLGKTCAMLQEHPGHISLLAGFMSYMRGSPQYQTFRTAKPAIIVSSFELYDRPYFTPPKYTRGSVIKSILIGAAITIVTTAVVAVTAITVKRKIQKQKALRQAKVESAWSTLTEDPTPENYQAYRKAVRANNRFTTVFGGTKYDYVNYWDGDQSEVTSSLTERITSIFNQDSNTTNDLPINSVSSVISIITGEPVLD